MSESSQKSTKSGPPESRGLSLAWLASVPVLLGALLLYSPSLRESFNPVSAPRPSVAIKQGTILGRLVDDGTFLQPLEGFLGIPYALPPVDDLRFRAAVPVPEGNGTLDAKLLGARYVPI
jgi:acetylcholinesterase